MSMFEILTELTSNLGVTNEVFILIVTVLSSIIFMAKEFRLGLLLLFFMTSIEFMIFYALGFNTMYHIIMILASFVILTISLLISYKKTQSVIV